MATKRRKIKKTKISAACKAAAKKKFKVWPSAYASGWGVRCTKAGGPNKMGKSKSKKKSPAKLAPIVAVMGKAAAASAGKQVVNNLMNKNAKK